MALTPDVQHMSFLLLFDLAHWSGTHQTGQTVQTLGGAVNDPLTDIKLSLRQNNPLVKNVARTVPA